MAAAVRVRWCPGPELNRYVSFETRDFKSRASASFATRAGREVVEANISVRRMWTPGASLEGHSSRRSLSLFVLLICSFVSFAIAEVRMRELRRTRECTEDFVELQRPRSQLNPGSPQGNAWFVSK